MTFYIPRHFRIDDPRGARALRRGQRVRHARVDREPPASRVSHIPFLPERGADGRLRLLGHVARANAHWQALEAAGEVLAIFAGPHAYVSPGWYESHPSVPTWNYAVVHARGPARLLPPGDLPALLDRLSRLYEDGRASPWRMAVAAGRLFPEHARGHRRDSRSRSRRLEGKFKLSQNRGARGWEGVAAALEAEGQGRSPRLMRAHAPAPDPGKGFPVESAASRRPSARLPRTAP